MTFFLLGGSRKKQP